MQIGKDLARNIIRSVYIVSTTWKSDRQQASCIDPGQKTTAALFDKTPDCYVKFFGVECFRVSE